MGSMAALSMPYWSIKRRTCNLVITKTSLPRIVSSAAIKSLPPVSRKTITMKNVDVSYRDRHGAFTIKDEGLEKEIQGTIQRLEEVVERIKELEMQKFMGRVRGTEFEDGVVLAETMSQEIVSNFLDKPIRYLRSCHGNQARKIKDVNFLIGILENSCLSPNSCSCIGVKNP